MTNVLGIDTSNYTTSIAIYSDSGIIEDKRMILKVGLGKRGLRQSDALFEHIKNIPCLLDDLKNIKIDGISVSTKPRPIEHSYMPVFLAGESIAKSIANVNNIPLIETTHQEGHIEAALDSLGLNFNKFIAFHLSGGTTEILKVENSGVYDIDIIGKSLDISAGQFLDRVGVKMGFKFPAGSTLDSLAMERKDLGIRIPSKVIGYNMNFSGQETMAVNLIEKGYSQNEIAYAVMICLSKTLQKICLNLNKNYNLPIVFIGGVSSSEFLKEYFKRNNLGNIHFTKSNLGSDNAVGVAKIGYKKLFG